MPAASFLIPLKPISSFAICVLLLSACIKKEEGEPNELPYPPIDIQRQILAGKAPVPLIRILDSVALVQQLEFLSSNICDGRAPGTDGHQRAITRIAETLRVTGVDSFGTSVIQEFTGTSQNGSNRGKNLFGFIRGTRFPEKYIVITAHYDHLGRDLSGAVFSGADDNASGVACVLSLAQYFKSKPHAYSVIFALFDKEETGLEGAYNFVEFARQSGLLAKFVMNINLDMIARSDRDELFACGIRHYPHLKPLIDSVQKKVNVRILFGHDAKDQGGDWTTQSDHSAFHDRDIPFIYLGVEDHADYHSTGDKFEKISLPRYVENCNAVALLINQVR